jgi:hypothetical protein
MKFVYFYSPSYEFYHHQFQEKITPHFTTVPLLIEDIKENENKKTHHFNGLTIKIELIIDQIEKEMSTTIIFSDATVFINEKESGNLESFIDNYKDYDICFIKEEDVFNIGFMKINCNKKTLSFFENVLNVMKSGKHTHDQAAVNYLLPESGLKYTTFDENIIYCPGFDHSKKNFIVYKSFIKNENKVSNFNQRIQNFYDNKLIDEDVYKKYFISENEGFSTMTRFSFNDWFMNFDLILVLLVSFILLYNFCRIRFQRRKNSRR